MLNTDFSEAREIFAKGIKASMNEHGVTQGIMMFIVAAIMLAVLLPVLSGVLQATPAIHGPLNATQGTVTSTIASSYGLLVVVLILIAAAVILGAIGLFRYFQE